jgi:uncharacterized membrane protein
VDASAGSGQAIAEILLVAMRWLHAVAAIVWIGAVIYELLILRPAVDDRLDGRAELALDAAAREMLQTALVVFLVSGAILTFERLSRGAAGGLYVGLLSLKVLLAVAMFQLGFRLRRATGATRVRGLRWLAALGLVIVFLASLLKSVYEQSLLG